MAELVWDQVGERMYQTGIDRGVLYLPDGSGVPWNGLVSVTEIFSREVKAFYLDGVKYLENHTPGDFSADLKAFTYPDEFDAINGIVEDDGVFYHDQRITSFGLSYRTKIGNDVSGTDHGYKLHILYNLRANPSDASYESIGERADPLVFNWRLSGVPVSTLNHKPTCHISIDSTKIDPVLLSVFEAKLYGTEDTDPELPPLYELVTIEDLTIVDNADGTWTAIGPEELITMVDSTTFEISGANAEYLDADTYEISSSEI